MAKTYIFVESIAKAKLIGQWLPQFEVVACKGHLKEIVRKKESVSWNKSNVEVKWDDSKLESFLKGKVSSENSYGIATDNDREGERIAYDLNDGLIQRGATDVYRLRFNEITKKSILKACQEKTGVNLPMAKAAQARSILDFYLGFNGSEKIWKVLPGAKSIGRIQCPSVNFLTQVYDEAIRKGIRKELKLELTYLGLSLSAKLNEGNESDYLSLLKELRDNLSIGKRKLRLAVKFFKLRELPPLNTASLLNELNRKFGYGLQKSMSILQALYDGSAEENSKFGLITYMRTDSTNLSFEWCKQAEFYLREKFGAVNLRKNVKREKTVNHEAIRPTRLDYLPNNFKQPEFAKVYNYVKCRTMAHFLQAPEGIRFYFEVPLSSDVILKSKDFYIVRRQGYEEVLPNLTKFTGWTIEEPSVSCAIVERSESLGVTEGRLIKHLETNNVGRPSTWYSLPKILKLRGYISSAKTINVSTLGRLLTYYLREVEPNLIEPTFTSHLEAMLDKISQGEELQSNLVNALKNVDEMVKKMDEINLLTLVAKKFSPRTCQSCQTEVSASYNRFKMQNYILGYVCKTCKKFSHIDASLISSPANVGESKVKVLRIFNQECQVQDSYEDTFMPYQDYWDFVKSLSSRSS